MNFTEQLIYSQQSRLSDLNFYNGELDGETGPLTENAMAAFKGYNGLLARPKPGPLTMQALWSSSAKALPPAVQRGDRPAPLLHARRLLGIKEKPGSGDNHLIMKWATNLDVWYPGDDTPWCGLFVAECFRAGAPDEPQDFNRLGARAWLKYGKESGPVLGGVAVFWRTHPTNSWHGHVAILTGISHDRKHIRVIGGNQNDMVSERWFKTDRVLGYRVPEEYPATQPPAATVGTLSEREN